MTDLKIGARTITIENNVPDRTYRVLVNRQWHPKALNATRIDFTPSFIQYKWSMNIDTFNELKVWYESAPDIRTYSDYVELQHVPASTFNDP